jgi:hypothetical protein
MMPTVAGRIPRISIRLRATACFVIGIICASPVAAADAGAPQLPRPPLSAPGAPCDQHPGTTLRQTGQVVVYGTAAGTNALGQTVTRYWACTLPTGSSTWVGSRANGGKYPPNTTMRDVTIAGPYVATVGSSGIGAAAKCIADDGHFCQRPVRAVKLVDALRQGAVGVGPVGPVGRLLVGAAGASGAAVWTGAPINGQITISADVMKTVRRGVKSNGGPVAHGPIEPSSLSLHGLRLRYLEHGKTHSLKLGNGL